MKELTIEEKAKAYDKAIERARKLATDLPNGRNDRLYHVWDLESIFPELKESEDERIRKHIIEDYISFETAKLLKEKGFDVKCNKCYAYFADDDIRFLNLKYPKSAQLLIENRYPCITLQMAMKWLREVHNIDIIAPPQYDGIKWTYSAVIFKLLIPCTEIRLNDNKDKKEEAVEIAVKYCLKNLI